jgi:hypothetical protein
MNDPMMLHSRSPARSSRPHAQCIRKSIVNEIPPQFSDLRNLPDIGLLKTRGSTRWTFRINCNGYAIASDGNHKPEAMVKAFEIARYGETEVVARFRERSPRRDVQETMRPPNGGLLSCGIFARYHTTHLPPRQ